MSAKVISIIDWKIRKAAEEAQRLPEKKTQLPRQVIVSSVCVDFIVKMIKLGYKAIHRDGYCILTRGSDPGGAA